MRMKKKCELCSKIATIYCESDQATLCYECDSKVHGAKFLVAKHSRTILCHVCQSPTQRTGSGPMMSYCQTCLSSNRDNVARHRHVHNGTGDHHDEGDEDIDDYGDDNGSDEDDNDDDDDGFEEDESHVGDDDDESEDDEENQVVPWSYSVSHPR